MKALLLTVFLANEPPAATPTPSGRIVLQSSGVWYVGTLLPGESVDLHPDGTVTRDAKPSTDFMRMPGDPYDGTILVWTKDAGCMYRTSGIGVWGACPAPKPPSNYGMGYKLGQLLREKDGCSVVIGVGPGTADFDPVPCPKKRKAKP